MTEIAYVNGAYMAHQDATIHIEDRGNNFADGVYEYIAFYHQQFLDLEPHLARLMRSLAEIRLNAGALDQTLPALLQKLVTQNGHEEGGVYLQVSRGVAPRNHTFDKDATPTILATIAPAKYPSAEKLKKGYRAVTLPDIRWKRCDIKSLCLLPNVLAKQEAMEAGADEAWLYLDDGSITEGTASNSYIIDAHGTLITHPADHHILNGITRMVVLELAEKLGIRVEQRAFSSDELADAAEAFQTSSSSNIMPVTHIDGRAVGDGTMGIITAKLLAAYQQHVTEQTGKMWE